MYDTVLHRAIALFSHEGALWRRFPAPPFFFQALVCVAAVGWARDWVEHAEANPGLP